MNSTCKLGLLLQWTEQRGQPQMISV